MDSNMRFIHDLLIKIDARLDELAETSARHDENLAAHMKRSDANEEAIELLKAHVNRVNGAVAFISLLAVLAGIMAAFK